MFINVFCSNLEQNDRDTGVHLNIYNTREFHYSRMNYSVAMAMCSSPHGHVWDGFSRFLCFAHSLSRWDGKWETGVRKNWAVKLRYIFFGPLWAKVSTVLTYVFIVWSLLENGDEKTRRDGFIELLRSLFFLSRSFRISLDCIMTTNMDQVDCYYCTCLLELREWLMRSDAACVGWTAWLQRIDQLGRRIQSARDRERKREKFCVWPQTDRNYCRNNEGSRALAEAMPLGKFLSNLFTFPFLKPNCLFKQQFCFFSLITLINNCQKILKNRGQRKYRR